MLATLSKGLRDLKLGLSRHEIWRTLAFQNVMFSFRKTWIGPFWLVIETAGLIFGIVVLKSMLIGDRSDDSIVFLVSGIVIYQVLISYLFGTSGIFLQGKNLLHTKGQPTSLPVFIYLTRATINAFYVIVGYLIYIAIIRPDTFVAVASAVIIMWSIAIFLGVGSALFFAPLSARFGDFGVFISTFSRFFMFITPVFWTPSLATQQEWWVRYNPLYHLIEIPRDFALREGFNVEHMVLGGLFASLMIALGFFVFSYFRKTIPLWV